MKQNVYSVGQVNQYIKNIFAQDFLLERILVRGEVSNCKYHASGHIYFTLKDAVGAIGCVMFAGNRKGLAFRMQEGDRVIVGGSVQVYERDGRYQLYARQITLDGVGERFERLEALKRQLEEMGMFAQEYKRPIPAYPRTIGIVTAPKGAAIRDIQSIAYRRNPGVQLILYPALVQGEDAVSSIINGIHALEQLGVDVMIVGRGGGSIEDLWAFNEEALVRAVFDCQVPVISAVGHETDMTLIDYVADLRAPTPSAAAELAVWKRDTAHEYVNELQQRMNQRLNQQLTLLHSRLQQLTLRMKFASPQNQLNMKRQLLLDLEEGLTKRMEQLVRERRHTLALLSQRIESGSPLRKLSAGYSLVTDETGRVMNDFDQIEKGMCLMLHMQGGDVKTRVEEKQCRK